ncbi:MAG TPA: glycosyltransferase [Blastocatellia bacterium]|nr:glycosyltransferase [Blastocatellia bacterium]
MRIWLLSSEVPWCEAGGIGRYCLNFSTALGAAGHDITWIGFSRQNSERQIAPGVRVIEIQQPDVNLPGPDSSRPSMQHPSWPYHILSEQPARSWQMADKISSLLRELPRPDIIESQEFRALPYYLLQRKLVERSWLETIPILVHLHSPGFELRRINQQPSYHFPEYWVGQMEKFSIVAADAVVSPSRFLADSVRRALGEQLEIRCLPYPMAVSAAGPGNDPSPEEIACIGRLELRKGVLQLVKACARLWAEGVGFRLVLIGGDTAFVPRNTTVATCLSERYAKWIKAGHLVLAGEVPHAEVQERLKRAWAVVVPSLWENFPNTCLEAMAAGQLVIASRNGGQAEMIEEDGAGGLLFDWNVSGDFERQMKRALRISPQERRAIGERARKRIALFCDPERIVEERVAHYQEVIARHTPRRIFPSARHASNGAAPVRIERRGEPGLLSVIIPFYNLGKYLEETLESVLASTWRPMEIVIVNDGSTDPVSLEVLDSIEKSNPENLRIIHTENQGLALARNAGARAARGEFIAFVDADDAVEKEFFARATDVLRRYENVAFVYSWVRFFEGSDRVWPTWNTELPYLLGHNMLAAFVVVRREWFEHAGLNDPGFEYSLEDYASWLGIVLAGGVGVSIPEPLVRYRVRPGSMSRSGNREERLYLYERLVGLNEAAYREYGPELFNLLNANGPAFAWDHPAQGQSDSAPFRHLGISSSDSSLQLAAKIIYRTRQNRLFRGLTRQRPIYRRLRALMKRLAG